MERDRYRKVLACGAFEVQDQQRLLENYEAWRLIKETSQREKKEAFVRNKKRREEYAKAKKEGRERLRN